MIYAPRPDYATLLRLPFGSSIYLHLHSSDVFIGKRISKQDGGVVMAEELRKTGISIVGDVPWGTHFCYFYETKQDLLDILVPYFKAGLESKEFCLWIISNSELITTEEAKGALGQAVSALDRYLAEGRIEIVPHDRWFLKGGVFDFHRVADRFKEKLDDALARGYTGMR